MAGTDGLGGTTGAGRVAKAAPAAETAGADRAGDGNAPPDPVGEREGGDSGGGGGGGGECSADSECVVAGAGERDRARCCLKVDPTAVGSRRGEEDDDVDEAIESDRPSADRGGDADDMLAGWPTLGGGGSALVPGTWRVAAGETVGGDDVDGGGGGGGAARLKKISALCPVVTANQDRVAALVVISLQVFGTVQSAL